jgi:hypothetical protein
MVPLCTEVKCRLRLETEVTDKITSRVTLCQKSGTRLEKGAKFRLESCQGSSLEDGMI